MHTCLLLLKRSCSFLRSSRAYFPSLCPVKEKGVGREFPLCYLISVLSGRWQNVPIIIHDIQN